MFIEKEKSILFDYYNPKKAKSSALSAVSFP